MGSIVGFTAYAYALNHLPITTVSLYAYINPMIAVGLGPLCSASRSAYVLPWRAPSCSRAPRWSGAL